jgi:hypothetical protein
LLPPDDVIPRQRTRHGKRSASNACALTFMVNRAALDNQKKYCPSGYNAQKCIRLYAAGAQKPSRGQLSLVCSLSL